MPGWLRILKTRAGFLNNLTVFALIALKLIIFLICHLCVIDVHLIHEDQRYNSDKK